MSLGTIAIILGALAVFIFVIALVRAGAIADKEVRRWLDEKDKDR